MKRFFKLSLLIAKPCLLFMFAILLIKILASNQSFVNVDYVLFYNELYPLYTSIFGWIPFSVGDILYISLGILFCYILYKIICSCVVRNWKNVIYWISRSIYLITFLFLIFHFLWGFNYYKKSLIEIYNVDGYEIHELKYIAIDLLNKCQRDSEYVHNGEVFKFGKKKFNQHIIGAIPSKYDVPYYMVPNQSIKKFSIFSYFMRYFGVSGYYNPFTGEAQITEGIPAVSFPFTIAHEEAHQMGYAREYEANYIGYLKCIESKDKKLNYSAHYKGLKYILRAIYPSDSTFVNTALKNYTVGMKADRAVEQAFYRKYEGEANEMFSAINHMYLKANQQKQGIQSYNRFVDLLVGHYRKYEF